ncbi:MAG TPA: hypothetical protein VJM50_15420 [Pyrinomonadaceae bacterium]|nr:hypothetical protein [Pyrinomonadaceae bacterium]
MRATKTRVSHRRRERKIESLKRRLERKSYPRLHASLILLLTGLAGFLVSFALLRLGVTAMWLRYPVAILFAYGVFLILLRVWLWLNRPRDLDLDLDVLETLDVTSYESTEVASPGFGGGSDFAGGGAGGSFGESVSTITTTKSSVSTFTATKSSGSSGFSFDLDLDEAWWILIAVVVLLGAVIATFYVIYIAPVLLAEILLDGVLLAGLYKQVKSIEHRHWLRGALRRTALPAGIIVVFFTIAGYAMQRAVPEAHSIGEVWKHITGG